MESYTIILVILALMIIFSGIAEKIKLPAPIMLIVVGLALGFFSTGKSIELNPKIVMMIFLPPLLYDAAFNIDFKQFRTHLNTIGQLAVGLVFLTTAGIAVAAHYLIPGMSWPLAFVLGAILSATDAVAAIGITKGLKLPHSVFAILEGESLLNDASALVAYRFAVAVVGGATFVWWQASLQFLIVLAGGVLVGMLMTWLLAFALRIFRTNNMVIICFMLLMPFVAYALAEHFGVSGVIAVVILGLGMSRLSRTKFPDYLKQQSKNFWDVTIFLLNGLIFVLMGLQFPLVLKQMNVAQIGTYLLYAFVITLIAFGIRLIRVYWQQLSLRKAFEGNRKVRESSLIDSKTSLIITWSGMRGIVSLAMAMGLPMLSNNQAFPFRNEIIFLSIAVVLISLIGQGITLPFIAKAVNKK